MSCQRKDILTLHLFHGKHPVCPISQVSQSPRHIYDLFGPSGRRTCELRAVFEKSLPSFLRYSSRNRNVWLLPKKNKFASGNVTVELVVPKRKEQGSKKDPRGNDFLE